jgi:biopolymer transport protein ExbD
MSRLSELRRTMERRDEINLAPLIDMIFILLIFFVVTTTFVKELEVEIERPGASSGLKAERNAVRVAIDRGGRIYVDGRPVRFWMIQDRLKSRLAEDPDRPVLVVADKSVPTGRLVEIVDECRLAGAEEVGVDVEPTE